MFIAVVLHFPILISHFCVAFIASMLPLHLFIFNLMVFLSLEYVQYVYYFCGTLSTVHIGKQYQMFSVEGL